MSTLRTINVIHPSGSTTNIVNDSSGNVTVGNDLTVTGALVPSSSFKRNRLINGNFDIWQRGTTGTGAVYVADRWSTDQANTTQEQSSSVPNVGSTYSLQVSASSGNAATAQKIESFNCSDLSGQQVTLSFYAKSSTGTPTLNFDVRYATALNNFASMTIMQGSTVTISTTWTKYTFTFNALNSNVANGLALFFYNTSTQTFFLSQVQLEVGTKATPYEMQIYSDQLAQCQRYYQVGTSDFRNYAAAASANFVVSYITMPMRTTPTAAFTAAASASSNISGTPTITPLDAATTTRFAYQAVSATDTYYVRTFSLSAEL